MSANMKTPYVRRDWTDEEHAELWRLKCEGVPIMEIARRIGRANSSCVGRLEKCDTNGVFLTADQRGIFKATPEQDAIMIEMHGQGHKARAIADRLGIGRKQAWGRLRLLVGDRSKPSPEFASGQPMTPKDPGIRTCLMCGREFASTHAGNRRCVRCRERVFAADTPFNPGIVGAV